MSVNQIKLASMITGKSISDQYNQWVARSLTVPVNTCADPVVTLDDHVVTLDDTFEHDTGNSDIKVKIQELETNILSLKKQLET